LRSELDGNKHKFSVSGSHFLPCSPGEHELELAIGDKIMGELSLRALQTRTHVRVRVLENEITELTMKIGTFGSVSIEVSGRPLNG
jgi:hypothetical protein